MNSSDLYRSYKLVQISVLLQENNRGMFIEQYWVGSPFTQWVKILNGTHISKRALRYSIELLGYLTQKYSISYLLTL